MTDTSVAPRSRGLFPTFLAPVRWLASPLGRRLLMALVATGAVVSLLGLVWREADFRGLPDPGDPFDLNELVEAPLAEESNAYVFYWDAASRLRPMPLSASRVGGGASNPARPPVAMPDRPQGPPNVAQWLQRNREAIDTWHQGTQCPDGRDFREYSGPEVHQQTLRIMRDFAKTAQLEADRLATEGDMAGAYRMHEGVLRSARHAARGGTVAGRITAVALHKAAADGIMTWAQDSRTDADLLRQALRDVQGDAQRRTPNSHTFKHEYQRVMKALDDPNEIARLEEEREVRGRATAGLTPLGPEFARWSQHDPERSKRVYRLWAANWLASCDLPRDQRPALIKNEGLAQFAQAPGANPNAPRLDPDDLERAFLKAPLARDLMPPAGQLLAAIDRETTRHETLVLALAERLYHREHGAPPSKLGDLIGPDLPKLPPGHDADDPPSGLAPPGRQDQEGPS